MDLPSLHILLSLFPLFLDLTDGLSTSDKLRNKSIELDAVISEMMKCRGMPGFVLTVVEGNETVLNKAYGWADVEQSRPMTTDTRLCIASCSKAFSAVLLGKLLQSHNYSWDTPINDILTHRCEFADDYVTSHVTSRDVMLHRTGVEYAYDMLWLSRSVNRTDIFQRVKHMNLGNRFRSEARYSNILFSLGGAVAEALGGPGKSWESLMEEEVLWPLQMFNTSFYHRRNISTEDFADSYTFNSTNGDVNGTYCVKLNPDICSGVEAVASAGSICASSLDMSHWMKALLCTLTFGSDNSTQPDCVLPADVVQETMSEQVLAKNMFTSRVPMSRVSYIIDGYGLGWFTGYYRGMRIVMHYGSLNTFSLLTLVSDLNLSIFTFFNGAIQDDPYTLHVFFQSYVIDLALGLEPWLNVDTDICSAESLQRVVSMSQGTVVHRTQVNNTDAYRGRFSNSIFGDVQVTESNDRLVLLYGYLEFLLSGDNSSDDVLLAEAVDEDHRLFLGTFRVTFSSRDVDDGIFQHLEVQLSETGDKPDLFTRYVEDELNLSSVGSCYSISSIVILLGIAVNLQNEFLLTL